MENIDGPFFDGTHILEIRNDYIAHRDSIEKHHPDKAFVRRTAKAFDALVHDICRVNRRHRIAERRVAELDMAVTAWESTMEDIDGPLIDGTAILAVRNGYATLRENTGEDHPAKKQVRRTAKEYDELVDNICQTNRRFIVAQQRADKLRVYFAHVERE